MGKNAIYINDSVHGLIRLSEYEKRIISSVGFNRLHDVYQNSTVYLTYPTNRTKRFEHSIGTMKLCTDMFYYSVLNATDESLKHFLVLAKKEINEVTDKIRRDALLYESFVNAIPYKSTDYLSAIDFSGINEALIPRCICEEDICIYSVLMQSIRVAALLHDIGHPPFSHVVEEAMMDIYKENIDKDSHSEFFSIIDECVSSDSNAHLHEKMGNKISASILYNIIPKDSNLEGRNLFEILIRECVDKIYNNSTPFFSRIHSIVDGDIDGDRLDYVTRDPLNSGMSYGSIDYSRIILDMKLIMYNELPYFCIPVKAINAAEDFFQRRFNLYKNIVFHHRVKKTDYLLKDVISRLLRDNARSSNEDATLLNINGLWRPMSGGTTAQVNTGLSQWNDSWLMTFLKYVYYEKYEKINFDPVSQKAEYVLKAEMSELLCNEKHFYSMIKRSEDHNIIDNCMSDTISNELGDINEYISVLDSVSEEQKQIEDKLGATVIDIEGMKSYLNQIKDKNNEDSQLMLTFEREKALYCTNDEDWKLIVRKCVNEACTEVFGETYIENIVVFNEYSSGIKGDVHFYDYKENPLEIIHVSNINKVIEAEYRFLPKIYIYVLINDKESTEKKNQLLSNIGQKLGHEVVELIKCGVSALLEDNKTEVNKVCAN